MKGDRVVGIFPTKTGKEAVVGHAEAENFEAILEIIRNRRRDLESQGYQPFRDVDELERGFWSRAIAGLNPAIPMILIVELHEKTVGFMHFGRKENFPPNKIGIYSFTVLTHCRGMGLGRALMISGLSEAEVTLRAKTVSLSVAEPNTRARRIYEKAGFQYVRGPYPSEWAGVSCGRFDMLKRL